MANTFDRRQEDLVGGALVRWIDSQPEHTAQLIAWLQGYDFPPVGHDDEPYLWLLRALARCRNRYHYESALAQHAARLVDAAPDTNPVGTRPAQYLYNLLMLCAGLSCPDHLTEPLSRMYNRRQLTGVWQGIKLADALGSALTENQLDNRLRPEWLAMLDRQQTHFLPGTPHDGFEGILHMPADSDHRGEPDLPALGYALTAMGRYLDDNPDRRPAFRSLIQRVLIRFEDRITWPLDFVRLADANNWTAWQVQCLPTLCFPLPPSQTSEPPSYIVAAWLLDLLSDRDYRVELTYCQQMISQIRTSSSIISFLKLVAPALEQTRLNNPYPSPRSNEGVINDALSELEIQLTPNLPDLAATIRDARRRRLVDNNLASTSPAGR